VTIRLHVVVEGETEEAFVYRVLADHLIHYDVVAEACLVTTRRSKSRKHKGGFVSYDRLIDDLSRWMKQDRGSDSHFTTMIDYYGLSRLRDEFPGLDDIAGLADPYERVAALEQRLAASIAHLENSRRFHPYLQLHEFEAIILVDPAELGPEFPASGDKIDKLVSLVRSFACPEHIDDGPETAPSKRIASLIPSYDSLKATAGPSVVARIGLARIRAACPHFDAWLSRLEALGGNPTGASTPQP